MTKTKTEEREQESEVFEYKHSIIEMVNDMKNPKILKLIYGFTMSGYKEEKAGRA